MEKTHAVDLRPWLAVFALGLVVAAIWAATALAGGSSEKSPASGGGNTPSFVQNDGDGAKHGSKDDCPERGGELDTFSPDV